MSLSFTILLLAPKRYAAGMHPVLALGVALIMLASVRVGADATDVAVGPAPIATSTPSPTPTATPTPSDTKPLVVGGYVRYVNTTDVPKSGTPLKDSSTLDLQLHFAYTFGASPFSVGATYLDALPIGSCSTPGPPLLSNCANSTDHRTGYSQNSFPQAYFQYSDPRLRIKLGNQTINTPWADSDTRTHLDPAAFQGAALHYSLNPHLFIDAADYIQFKPYDSSTFSRSTLLTSASTLPANIFDPSGQAIQTNGFVYGRVGYAGGGKFTANAYFYGIQNISNILWMDASYPLGNSSLQPFIKMQAGSERSTGAAVIGQINSSIIGFQTGVNLTPALAVTIGFDGVPNHTDTVSLPAGYSCPAPGSNGANVIAVNSLATSSSLGYFLPTGGTGNCTSNANGTTTLYDGGWASPYTDSNATDPLFTTPLLEGIVDRRSPGSATSAALTYTAVKKQFIAYVSETFFNYNNPAYAELTHETDADALYYFSRVRTTPYKGLLFHYRYGNLTQSGASASQGLTFNKFQLEYDF